MFTPVTLQQMPQNLYQLCQILRNASQILQQQYQLYTQGDDFEIQHKQDESPVTQADLLVNAYLEEALADLSEQYPILSEEGDNQARKQWHKFWLIDPLDGTKEFIHKTGEFTINVSLIGGGESLISILAVPLKQTIYIGQKGELPYRLQWNEQGEQLFQYELNSLQDNVSKKIKVAISRRRKPRAGSRYDVFLDGLTKQDIQYETVEAGSAYKFCMMLEGEIDLYPRLHPTCEWDTAAGQGLLESIGGALVTPQGERFVYNQRASMENGHFIALVNKKDWLMIQKMNDGHKSQS